MSVENRFCCAPVEILHVLLDEELLDNIEHYTVQFSRVENGRTIDSLVNGLHTASSDSARRRFSFFTGNLSDDHMCTHPLDISQPRHVTVIAVLGLVVKISC